MYDFEDIIINQKHRCTLGIEKNINQHFVSIIAEKGFMSFEEHYHITQELYEEFQKDEVSLLHFINNCHRRNNSHSLFK